jgi:hypothetical protein
VPSRFPPLRTKPGACYNYRQCRDNPPQFYGMLCHEVFAPHGQLHALRGINTPSVLSPSLVRAVAAYPVEGSRVNEDLGTDQSREQAWRQS